MKKFLTLLGTLLLTAQSVFASGFDDFMSNTMTPIFDGIANIVFTPIPICGMKVPVIIFWILFAGIFFTIYFRGIAIWGFKHALDVVTKPTTAEDGGDVSSFQALATALSGTIGIGSIAGVSASIYIGGPGAAFWIFAGAILGMSIKFVEATLAVKYRRFNLDGSVSGGPMHYIAHGLTRKNMRWLGQPLSVIFAILCIAGGITGGNMIQINQSTQQVLAITSGGFHNFIAGHLWVLGLIVAVIIGLVIVGGIKSIAKVTTVLVPTMCFLYILSGLIVIFVCYKHIPYACVRILTEAFNPPAIAGGIFGVIIIGLRRSVQSNEAGTGAAAIVYASAQTKEPVSQGFVALLETFLTGILCLLTSFVILFTNPSLQAQGMEHQVQGIVLASKAFGTVLGFFPYILSTIAILFAISTLISWAYYGQKAWTFLFGEGRKRELTFNLLYCLFIVIGSVMQLKPILNITDAMMIAMCVPNIIVLYILAPEIKNDLKAYCIKQNLAKLIYKDWYKPVPVVENVSDKKEA